ncbi:MAG TPA: Hsp70 family protein [Solirubrobacteraceae bacterium]|jgi:molecular chaperone DnaK|nr:Hsp70 family protein [Solirubrobacteraceae bacterium]
MPDHVVIGIDLGTTFSAVAAIDHGRPRVLHNRSGGRATPSVVYFEPGGEVVVGDVARNQAIAEPERTVQCIKREMGTAFSVSIDGEEYLPETISGLILKALKEDAEAALGTAVVDAVVTVPAYFKDSQRTATRKAGEIADLNVIAMINEPTAAAVAYGLVHGEAARKLLVYDFGGGTFDVTVLDVDGNELTVIATDGVSKLGGVDIDNRLADYLVDQFKGRHGADLRADPATRLDVQQKAEQAKIDLSARQSTKVMLAGGGASTRVDITREQFDELIGDLLAQTEECMNRALSDAGLGWEEIDVVLPVGGSSRLASVRELLERVTGKAPARDANPDDCVVIGAAMRADLDLEEHERSEPSRTGEREPLDIVINDVASHSLGVRALTPDGTPVNSIIIPRLTRLPCERKREYRTRSDGQRAIEIEVLQGEDSDPFSVDVESVGTMRVDDLPPRPAGAVKLRVTLRYDGSGVVEVVAEELDGHRVARAQLLQKSGELDDDTLEEQRALIQRRFEAVSESGGGADGAPVSRQSTADEATVADGEEPAGDEAATDAQQAPDLDAEGAARERSDENGEAVSGKDAGTEAAGEAGAEPPAVASDPSTPAATNGSTMDLYQLLELEQDAAEEDIARRIEGRRTAAEQALSALSAEGGSDEEAEKLNAELHELDQAAAILLDPTTRADYDAHAPEVPDAPQAPDPAESES